MTNIADFIDHTLLKPEATAQDIQKLCEEALRYKVAAVCVNGDYVSLAKSLLKQSNIKIASVVGFPLGAMTSEAKAAEARKAVEDGADEIDMVLAVGRLKFGDRVKVEADIRAVVTAASQKTVKVILETCLLTPDEKMIACQCAVAAGAHFVKTSTGFSRGGATVEDVELLRKTVGRDFGVKASGGVRTLEDALMMIQAGATRIGTSNTVAILTRAAPTGTY